MLRPRRCRRGDDAGGGAAPAHAGAELERRAAARRDREGARERRGRRRSRRARERRRARRDRHERRRARATRSSASASPSRTATSSIIEKPAGVTSVPYERKDAGTALDLIRTHWRHAGKRATATPLYTVHRLDKDTSGLLCFAKTRLAERALHEVFQRHTARREYVAVAHGAVESRRIESSLVADRGDGIRGSTPPPRRGAARRHPRRRPCAACAPRRSCACASRPAARIRSACTSPRPGTRSSARPSTSATCCARAREPLPSPRLMLHAATLGLPHPVTGEPIDLRAAPPPDFIETLEALGGSRARSLKARSARRSRRSTRRCAPATRPARASRRTCPTAATIPAFLERTAPLLEFLWSRYFRVRLLGVENIPDAGAALLVANHSGGIPYDGTLLMYGIHRDHPHHRRVRPLVANFAFRSGWMSHVVARVGGVRASTETALPLLAAGQLLAVFPEGLKGVGKLYRERYRLARFGRGGFARLAREAARADDPRRHRRRRGDPPRHRQAHGALGAARPAVHPDHADLPVAGSLRAAPGSDEVDHPDRRADSASRPRTTFRARREPPRRFGRRSTS